MRPYTIQQRLKQIIDERHLKQVDILRMAEPYCRKFNVKLTKSDLSQYLSGTTPEPKFYKISVLSYALGVSEAWLMGFDVPVERSTPIPGVPENGRKARLSELFDRLPEEEQDEIISLIEWKLSRK